MSVTRQVVLKNKPFNVTPAVLKIDCNVPGHYDRRNDNEARWKHHSAELVESSRNSKIYDKRCGRQRGRHRAIRSEIRVQAAGLGFADPDDAWRFIDADAIETDEDGEPKNARKLLEDLLKAKPYLARPSGNSTNGGPPPSPKPNGAVSKEQRVQDIYERMRVGTPRL